MMTTVFFRKRLLAFSFVLAALVLASCGGRKNVDLYPGSVDTPATRQHDTGPDPKTLPSMGSVRNQPQQIEVRTGSVPEGFSEAILPVLTLVADRIAAYEDKQQAWDAFIGEIDQDSLDEDVRAGILSCRSRLQAVLEGYNRLHEDLIRESADVARETAVPEQLYSVQREDIGFLESDCRHIPVTAQQGESWLGGNRSKLLDESEKAISDALVAAAYPEIVRLYEELSEEAAGRLSFESRYAYGLALLRTGREQEAGNYLRALLSEVRQEDRISREFQLMRLIADIQFGLEDYPAAFNRYVDIINRYAGFGDVVDWARKQQEMISARGNQGVEVKSYSDLILAWLAYNPVRDGYKPSLLADRFAVNFPESRVLPIVNRIRQESRDQADAWFATVVQQLDQLENEKKYAEAVRLIEKLPVLDMPDERREYVRNRADELISAQYHQAETERLAREASLQETRDKGRQYLRAREYDQAIEVFTGLLGTEYDETARAQINEAANLAAQEDRRKAAEFFVRSSRVSDEEARIQLLFESRRLLENILIKYPQSDLVDKVRKNLDRIESEISSIDPDLLLNPPVTEVKPATVKDEQAAGPQVMNSMNVGELQVQPASNKWPDSGEPPEQGSIEE